MKLILSPSKTKTIKGLPEGGLFQQEKTKLLISKMCSFSLEELGKIQKLKLDKAQEVARFFSTYEKQPVGAAAESYSGLAFKNLDWSGLSEKGKAFGKKHLVILSGLYGVVLPMSPVKDYRLDLVDPIFKADKTDLYAFWTEAIQDYFQEEDYIINLASKEYSKLISHPHMITIEFWEDKKGVLKQLSTTSKQMRGRLAHYILEVGLTKIEDLPESFDGFSKTVEGVQLIRYIKS